MSTQYQQQTKTVCTNTNDPSCQASQAQFNTMNALQAQLNSNSQYDVPPSPPALPAKTEIIIQGFTSIQSATLGLFVGAALFIIYGLVGRAQRRGK